MADMWRWYVVQTYSGYENRVKAWLEKRVEEEGRQSQFGKILVPTEEVVEMRGGQKRKSDRKFFPGYVLVQMTMEPEAWYLVKNVPKVLGFLGGGETPTPISDKEAEMILNRVAERADKPQPKTLFEAGEVVRVTDSSDCRL